jgi:glyoxylate reductase
MKKKILVNYALPKEILGELHQHFEVIIPETGIFTRQELLELIPQCHGLVAVFQIKVDEELLNKGANLKIIASFGAGYDHIDTAYATKKGIVVVNIPVAVTNPTAELTLGLMLSLARRITEGDRRLRARLHSEWSPLNFSGSTLEGKTLGIIGMGRIGLRVSRLAQAFGMRVLYTKRSPYTPEIERELELNYAPLEDLLRTADVLSLHCPLTPETHHLLGEREFAMMKPSSLVINTARGPVIKESALIKALKEGLIRGAALDVFEFEPHVTEELLSLDNLIITPHIGCETWETREVMSAAFTQHFLDFFAGKRPQNIVNPQVLEKI